MTPNYSGRIIPHRLPSCPGRDSRYTLRHNTDQPDSPWWVYYELPSGERVPADDPHTVLVNLVNALKRSCSGQEGGAFSLNEHGQVIARTSDPGGVANAVHLVGVSGGQVVRYDEAITFRDGALDPSVEPSPGEPWPGPLCGMTYKFAAPGNRKPPSRCLDEVFVEVEGRVLLLSVEAGINPYPPAPGQELATFLAALRQRLPQGGRFRVNEHGRAFTSDTNAFIGTAPLDDWFPELTPRS